MNINLDQLMIIMSSDLTPQKSRRGKSVSYKLVIRMLCDGKRVSEVVQETGTPQPIVNNVRSTLLAIQELLEDGF